MSGTSTPANRDHQLLEVGKQCSSPICGLVDFLPLKCQHCAQPFCGDHFLPTAHSCEKYDAAKHDRIAPSCPLCNTPVAIPPGQDPNIRMEQHINTECSVMTGRMTGKSAPTCARGKCGKVLFAPIRCGSCKQQFCPAHRFPQDHSCSSAAAVTSKPSSAASTWNNMSNQTSVASTAALAAIKRAAASKPVARPKVPVKKETPPPTASSSSKPAGSGAPRPNPFSSTERRAKAERESRRKAIQERARKGIPLSEEEKAFLAEGGGKDDCVVM
ncbi:uncharacterized protein BXZ73DRAFT_51230 [Epithele typhae]|uniref:uncharacterized protein n=1 Tax=Epithele typhae TaxID=378194 RepID=UPI002007AC6F|nr:uncharacterized protein BXZ73DRAFT_51230 [Epithele typhae]KAH9922856.1 hypothetical protein BXZ73DRAFT_51230 [Epithele typhae]